MSGSNRSEALHDDVYGGTFNLYDKQALSEFIEPFRIRFRENGISPRDKFSGARCLDAGCGGGRGSIFMLENGAAHVTATDFSDKNIETTRKNLLDFGFNNFSCQQATLESLPFDDASFDFVWCNGVLMHTENPDRCFAEISRVLKPGGGIWLYVYGGGGLYWYFIRHVRELLRGTSVPKLIAALQLANYPTGYIAEYVDDWKTPFLRCYQEKTVTGMLEDLGFTDIQRMMKGTPYDTSARIVAFPEDKPFLGVGDLRFLAVKKETKKPAHNSLSRDHIEGNVFEADRVVTTLLHDDLEELAKMFRANQLGGILACARVQRYLRAEIMSASVPIDVVAMSAYLKETLTLFKGL
jgi:ubiquinone/menaquinone biosynthesis C-methylase UbiE